MPNSDKEKLNSKITKPKEQEEDKIMTEYEDADEQDTELEDRITFVYDQYKKMRDDRNQGFKWFGLNHGQHGGRNRFLNLIEYINESETRLNGDIEKPSHKDDWQSNIFDNITREKVISIIARLAAQRMKAVFLRDEGISNDLAVIVTNLYDRAGRGKNGKGRDDEFTVKSMWEAVSKGTVVREEGYKLGKRRIKDRKLFTKTGKIKYKTIYEWEDVWSEVVPLEEFYPGDISKTNIQEMGSCCRATRMGYETFRVAYNDFEEAKNVSPAAELEDDARTKYDVEMDVEGKEVLVIKYYNRVTDSFDIVANGRLLTKLGNPLPYEHKSIPFTVARFEILSNKFFYGMSLPFKLASMQDMTNSLWNLGLDQLILALKTPIFNASGADIDIDWLYPNNVIDLKRGADLNGIKEMKLDTNSFVVSQNALQIIKGRLDSSAGSGSEASGVAGAGRGRTAEEVSTAKEAALDILGLFLRFMEWAEEDRAEQRVQIMLEKYPERLKSNGKQRRFIIDGVRLLNGEYGKMFVNITNNPRTFTELTKENIETDELSQNIDIKPTVIRNLKLLLKIVPDSSLKETELKRREDELRWFSIAGQRPDIFDVQASAIDLAEKFKKDPNKVVIRKKQGGPEEEIASLLGGGEQGEGRVRVPTDKEMQNAQADTFIKQPNQ